MTSKDVIYDITIRNNQLNFQLPTDEMFKAIKLEKYKNIYIYF